MPCGTHLCHFYQTPQDMLDVLVPYMAAGLERNEKCLWIVDGVLTVAQAKEAMAEVVPDWKRHLESGSIEFFPHTEWYVIDGAFDETRVLRQFVDQEVEALAAGFKGLRVTGNTLWARDGMLPDLLQYEREVDQCFCNHKMTAICTYPLDRCSAADIVDVTKAHEMALIRREGAWDLIESATLRHVREELRESHERLKTLAQQMAQVEQQERRRISRALHDGLQQTIVGTQMNLERARNNVGPARDEALSRISELLNEALDACRALTTEIYPPILHERGLLPAFQWLAAWFEKQHRFNVRLDLPEEEPVLGDSERVTLFEVARELLFNVVKHAQVAEADICVRVASESVELIVRDEGNGYDPDALDPASAEGHFGLCNIRERVRMMDGDLVIESAPGCGSRVAVNLPLASAALIEPERDESRLLSRTTGSGRSESVANVVASAILDRA